MFVYGTLKRGERNHHLVEGAGLLAAGPAELRGFDLYDLEPDGYPALVAGSGVVFGELLTLPGEAALTSLDELEEVDRTPPTYERVRVVALVQGREGDEEPVGCWVYLYAKAARLAEPGVRLVPGGVWPEAKDQLSKAAGMSRP